MITESLSELLEPNRSLHSDDLIVFKFGGSSVGTPERFQRMIDTIVQTARKAQVVVVVSALSNVTRQLSSALESFTTDAHRQPNVVRDLLSSLQERHLQQARRVMDEEAQSAYAAVLDERLDQLERAFDRVRHEGFSPAARDAVLVVGEQLSVPMAAGALRSAGHNASAAAATELVTTDDTFGEANVKRNLTRERVDAWYANVSSDQIPVVAGFIGSTPEGQLTTLGFEGSDYSAALFAAMLDARVLVRYTDVDGLYTKDPSKHDDAERIDRLSMEKAFALTESGRLGMHPKTLRPLVHADIPLHIRSIDRPEQPGTEIIPEIYLTPSSNSERT